MCEQDELLPTSLSEKRTCTCKLYTVRPDVMIYVRQLYHINIHWINNISMPFGLPIPKWSNPLYQCAVYLKFYKHVTLPPQLIFQVISKTWSVKNGWYNFFSLMVTSLIILIPAWSFLVVWQKQPYLLIPFYVTCFCLIMRHCTRKYCTMEDEIHGFITWHLVSYRT
jgi:hypothetical protein